MAPGTARNGNLATAADFVPRSIVTSPERLTSTRYGCFNTVGVAVGTLVGCAVSPGAKGAQVYGSTGARVYGAKLGYGDGSWMTSEGAKLSSTVGGADGGTVTIGTSLGSVVGNTEGLSVVGVGDVGTELGSDVGIGVGGLGAGVVGVIEG